MKTGRDIAMGLFYIMIGGFVVYAKSFANIAIPPLVAYILGGMMLVGGLFRFYKGIRMLFPHKDDTAEDSE